MLPSTEPLLLAIFLALLAYAVRSDWKYRRVPNQLTMLLATSALTALIFDVQPFSVGWQDGLVAFFAGLSAMLMIYRMGFMGAADVKFAAALGLWIGLLPLLWMWIGASLMAAFHALALLAWRRHMRLPRTRKREIPYVAHMAVATMGWILWQHHIF
ncbi:MAG: prepilin peptidase [Comamonadaceae bacterium]|nr:MAG: prepilin peptidase [Comamonadaceae bacterium]